MFEAGDKIICIDENPIDILDGIMISGNGITYGKEYTVWKVYPSGHISVWNDCESLTMCEPKLFTDTLGFRKMKIDKICSRLAT
jgi:hypothetical protein